MKRATLREHWLRLSRAVRRMAGVPDYDTYVEHMRLHHPGQPVLGFEAFFRERLEARYRSGGGRCC